jgi:hypothetical protein
MRFPRHFHETPPRELRSLLRRFNTEAHKTAVWNAFVDSELSGINEDDCAIVPRVLPRSYLPVVRETVRDLTLFAMRLLSLPEKEIRAIFPQGPIRDFLLDELEVARFHPQRLIGSFRYDLAIVGEPEPGNAPKLLEINEIGFDGLARSSFIQKTLLDLIPGLNERVIALDTARAEVRNMMRLGRRLARFQYDCYNWDEEYLLQVGAKLGAEIRLVSPAQYGCEIDADFPLLMQKPVAIEKGRVRLGDFRPDAVQMSLAFGIEDYEKGKALYRKLVRSRTPQYGPFLTGLVASKMILVLLSDRELRKKILGSARRLENVVLPAFPLEGNLERTRGEAEQFVIKHVDGCGGEQVFLGDELVQRLRRIRRGEHGHWVVQERTRLNTLEVNGILSRSRRVISDLGVFVHYDWSGGKFDNFEMGGIITRATNRSFKVNVSGGGIQVPVMFLRK